MMLRRPNAPHRAQIRQRLSPYEQARVLRACYEIQAALRPVSCSSCRSAEPTSQAARLAGWVLEPNLCPSCIPARAAS